MELSNDDSRHARRIHSREPNRPDCAGARLARRRHVEPARDTGEVVELLEEWLSPLPVDVSRFEVDPAKPNLLVTLPGTADRTRLFNGRLDTVPFDGDTWSRDPLGERVHDRTYGREQPI
nr:hypothetical protein [Halomicroarcula amylolytica]